MYFTFTIKSIEPLGVHDNPFVLLDKRMELYQTWQLTGLEKLEDSEDVLSKFVRQGFSVKGADVGAGSHFRQDDGIVKVWDPTISFSLPKLNSDDSERTYRLDVHHWEHDKRLSTNKVRATFSDSTLEIVRQAWIAANQDEEAAKKALFDYLKNANFQDIIQSNILNNLLPVPKWVQSATNLIPLLELIVRLISNNSDDYIDQHRLIFQIRRVENGQIIWRFNSDQNEINTWNTNGEGTQLIPFTSRDRTGKIRYKVVYQVRVMD